MKIKFKWILFCILIISIIITIVLFINFKRNNVNDNNINDNDPLYNVNWFRVKDELYRDGRLISSNPNSFHYYIKFDKDYINFCDSVTNECKSDKYNYGDGKLKLFSTSIVSQGEYDVTISSGKLKLSTKFGNSEAIYYFEEPLG